MDESKSTNSNCIHDDFQKLVGTGVVTLGSWLVDFEFRFVQEGYTYAHTFWGWKKKTSAKARRRRNRIKPMKRISASEMPCCSCFTPPALWESTDAASSS